jgi:hypothetical protein
MEQIMPGIFGDNFLSLLSPLATAQYRPTPAATFPDPAAPSPGPLAIPPATPPIFLSPPDQSSTALAQPAGAWDGIGQSLTNGINNHALTLMALGAGIAQGGVGKGLELAATAAQAERNLRAQQVNFKHVYEVLTGAGVPAEEALAAVISPSLMRTLAVKYLGPKSPSNAPTPPVALASARNLSPGIPEGSAYSPATWKAPDGHLFDEAGNPVK